METPEIAPLNNATSCKLYDKVISFNPTLHAVKNHVLAELPCWDANDLTQAVQNDRDCGSNTFSMIAANKNFKNPVKYKDLYKERARIIQYFETSNTEEFKLYGSAWNIRQELLAFPKLQKIVRKLKIPGNLKSYGGICVSKNDVIRSSTFNICFENCVYPGYLSEKVFDAILGGSIPIYWGHDGIPKSLKTAVIDASQFQSQKNLVQHCRSLDIEERLEIIRNGMNFLQSDGPKYSHQIYADQITRHIEKLLLAQ
ncbi:hypothetical protein HKCCD6035_02250 [Rhodobacterales bacterium HKCCD6035]|nr:hypothetical protein [Rhodobacterales bacterium HKCCD6035]